MSRLFQVRPRGWRVLSPWAWRRAYLVGRFADWYFCTPAGQALMVDALATVWDLAPIQKPLRSRPAGRPQPGPLLPR
jgi:hypothetical protein